MADYLGLRALYNDADLRNRVTHATTVYADSLIAGNGNGNGNGKDAKDRKYASDVIDNPDREGQRVLYVFIARHSDLTVQGIKDIVDADMQTDVNEIGEQLANALAGE